jgi:hypothetical protein
MNFTVVDHCGDERGEFRCLDRARAFAAQFPYWEIMDADGFLIDMHFGSTTRERAAPATPS